MNTWTYKRGPAAVLMCLALAACGGSDGATAFNAFLSRAAPDDGAEPAKRPDVSLSKALLAKGAVAVVPPDGFCVDSRALRDDFAVLARCDSLGGKGQTLDAPLGMILVSTSPVDGPTDVEALLPDTFGPEVQVLERYGEDGLALAHLLGGAPEGVDPVYWRALARIKGHLVSMSAYAPRGGSLATLDGGRVLTDLAVRTQAASGSASQVATADNPRPRGGLRSRISGLFNRKAFVQ